jgi:hypothetical protein
MEQFKKAKVVMLPTEIKESNIILDNSDKFLHYKKSINSTSFFSEDYIYQHLYIISDDEIKEGDWILIPSTNGKNHFDFSESIPKKAESNFASNKYVWKIIATTDTSLKKPCTCIGMRTQVSCNWICETHKDYFLPQLPQEFIEYYIREYNNGNVISDVLVEEELDTIKSACTCIDGNPFCSFKYYDGTDECCRKLFPDGEYWNKTSK